MMELRKPAEMLFHSVQSPLLPLLAPSVYRAPYHRVSSVQSMLHKKSNIDPQCQHPRRMFSVSIRPSQQATATKESTDEKPSSESSQAENSSTSSRPAHAKSAEDYTSAVEDRLSFLKPRQSSTSTNDRSSSSSSYTPRFANRVLNNPNDSPDALKKKPSSISDFMAVFNERADRKSGGRGGGGINISRMADDSLFSSPSIVRPTVEDSHLAPPFRVGSSLGRTIAISDERGMDLGRALRTLDGQLTVNAVRRDMHSQKFHERPGLKRKRLASARWRARFKRDFKAVAQRVLQMRRQGW